MADTQVQHYVPRFLLRRFGTGKKEHVHVFDKQTGKRFTSSARKIAAEKGLYDFKFKGVTLTLEPGLAELEARAARHIARITQERRLDVLNPIQRGELARFLAVQMVRTPAFWETSHEMFERMENWLRKEGMREDWFYPPAELGTRENAEKATVARAIYDAPRDLGPALVAKDWVLLQTDRKHPYVIGDHPLAMHNMIDHSPRGNLGLKVEGIEIYFPLSPQLSLGLWCPSHREFLMNGISRLTAASERQPWLAERFSGAWAGAIQMMEAITKGIPLPSQAENVLFFNSLQISTAERFVFSADSDFSLAEDMIKENSELRHGRRLVEGTGKF